MRTENGTGDPVTPLFPLTFTINSPSVQMLGELHNVYWVSGAQGTTAEDEVIDGSDTYIIFQNIHRTDNWTFYAIRDE